MVNRVAIIANTIIRPGMSGGNRIFIECGKRWSSKGVAIDVFTSDVGSKLCNDNGLSRAHYVTWSSSPLRALGPVPLYLLGTIRGLLNILQNPAPAESTFVYSSSDFWPDSIPALVAKLRNRKLRWIASFYLFARSPWSKEFPYRGTASIAGLFYWITQIPIFLLARKFADAVFVTNEPDRGRFLSRRLTPDRVVAVHGGVDAKATALIPDSQSQKYDAVFLGRFHPQKGALELIDIWKRVCAKKKFATLAMIGIGQLENQIRRKIVEYELEESVDLLGFKDGADKLRILKNCKIGLYPAILDHWSMAPVELMASGLPLVTFDVPTLKSLDPKGMIRVPCYDLASFANAVVMLMDDQNLYQRIRTEAFTWAGEWDWDRRADVLLDAIASFHD